MEDERAGEMRIVHAKESRARKASEAARLKAENEQNRQRLMKVTALTDNSVHDEPIQAIREAKAREAKERRKAEAVELARLNADYQARLKASHTQTDDDIRHDEAYKHRNDFHKVPTAPPPSPPFCGRPVCPASVGRRRRPVSSWRPRSSRKRTTTSTST